MMEMRKPKIVDLNESIRRTAELIQNRIPVDRIQLDLKLSAKSPQVLANPAELTKAIAALWR